MHVLAVGGPPCIDDRGSLGGEYELSAGDTVRVDLDLETTKLMQEGHGGWDDAMADVNLHVLPVHSYKSVHILTVYSRCR